MVRKIEDIRADGVIYAQPALTMDDHDACHNAMMRLFEDIPDLLAMLAEKDTEIEGLKADRRRLIGFRHCPQCGDWLIDIDYGDGRIGGMGCIECDFEMEVR